METATFAYSPYGHIGQPAAGTIGIGFNGELLDKHSGFYPLGSGYRPYSPLIMRFVAADSWSPFGKGGINCYAYCSGDPVNYKDPTGHVLVHLKNGQTMKVNKNSAVALPHRFKPSTLKRTTSHASGLKPTADRSSATPEPANYFMKIAEPDIIENIIGNLSFKDTIAFSNSSKTAYDLARPVINKYIHRIFSNHGTIRKAIDGALPGVPSTFSQTIGLTRAEYLNDIDRIQNLGGPVNVLALIRHGRQNARRNALSVRRGSLEDLIVAAD